MPTDPLSSLRAVLPSGWTINSHLASGGQGHVFRGAWNSQPAAIKVFTTTRPERLTREISLLQGLACPTLVKLLGHCSVTLEGASATIVAYELLNGPDLNTASRTPANRLSPVELVRLGRSVGGALEALWGKRIVHRDVKPANIVRHSGDFILVDVGLARHLDLDSLTAAGNHVGTRLYMSPEQYKGVKNLSIRSDAFSLGITLFELAALQHPFGRQPVLTDPPAPKLATIRKDLPADFCKAVDSLLQIVVTKRPTSLVTLF